MENLKNLKNLTIFFFFFHFEKTAVSRSIGAHRHRHRHTRVFPVLLLFVSAYSVDMCGNYQGQISFLESRWKNNTGPTSESTDMESNKRVVVPVVNIGNIGQYVCQTLIERAYADKECSVEKTGIDTDYLYPFSGKYKTIAEARNGDVDVDVDGVNDGVNDGVLVTPLEKYVMSNSKDGVDVIQLHSPIIPGCESRFFSQLQQHIHGYEEVVVVTSADRGLFEEDAVDAESVSVSLADHVQQLSLVAQQQQQQQPRHVTAASSLLQDSHVRALVESVTAPHCNGIKAKIVRARVYEGENFSAVAKCVELCM